MEIQTAPAPVTRAELRAAERPNRRKKALIAGAAAGTAALVAGVAGIGANLNNHQDQDSFVRVDRAHNLDIDWTFSSDSTDSSHPGLLSLKDALPGDVVTGTIRVDNGSTEAYAAVSATDVTGTGLLDAATLTIGGEDAPLWDGGTYQLGAIPADGYLEIPVTLTIPDTIDNDTWEQLPTAASLVLSMDAVQAKHTTNPGQGYQP